VINTGLISVGEKKETSLKLNIFLKVEDELAIHAEFKTYTLRSHYNA